MPENDQQVDEKQETFKPIESQEQFDAIIRDRIDRAVKSTKAKFSDYEDLKAKAGKFDELEESKKTEDQKRLEEIEKLKSMNSELEKQIADHEATRLRFEVATEKKVPVAILNGSTREELENQADELLKWRGDIADVNKRQGSGNPDATLASLASGRERAKKAHSQNVKEG